MKKFCDSHHDCINQRRSTAGNAAIRDADNRCDETACNADKKRGSAPVPKHGKNIAAQRIRAKPKFFVRRFIQVGKIELCGIVVDKQMGEKTGENDSA